MINSLLKRISTELFLHESSELILLKWLIAFRHKLHVTSEQKESMLIAFKKCKLDSETGAHEFSDIEYAKKIYSYAIDRLPYRVQKQFASDHAILLYVYAALTSPMDPSESNCILDKILFQTKDDLHRPTFTPNQEQFPPEEYWPYHDPSDVVYLWDTSERIIFALYLWILDISIFYEYNSIMKQLSTPTKKTFINIPDSNLEKIWKICKESDSRYGYFYKKMQKSPTHAKLKANFLAYMEEIPSIAFSLLPALITEIINTMAPEKARPSDNNQGSFSIYENLIKKTEGHSYDTAYLKMLLLPPNSVYNKNTTNKIHARFKKIESEILQNFSPNPELNSYLSSLNAEDEANGRYLIALRSNDFTLSYTYFEIFLKIYENQELFKCSEKMDFALSVIMLNHFTRWFDAIMLSYQMPFELCARNLLYSKLLSANSFFQSTVTELSKISISTSDEETKFTYGMQSVSCHAFPKLFYSRTRQNRLNRHILCDIFKKTERKISPAETLPIAKWIFLLEHHNIDDEYIKHLIYSGYQEYLERPKGSIVLPPNEFPDPFADNFTLSDYYRFFLR